MKLKLRNYFIQLSTGIHQEMCRLLVVWQVYRAVRNASRRNLIQAFLSH
jgi:hypothetical protein